MNGLSADKLRVILSPEAEGEDEGSTIELDTLGSRRLASAGWTDMLDDHIGFLDNIVLTTIHDRTDSLGQGGWAEVQVLYTFPTNHKVFRPH